MKEDSHDGWAGIVRRSIDGHGNGGVVVFQSGEVFSPEMSDATLI